MHLIMRIVYCLVFIACYFVGHSQGNADTTKVSTHHKLKQIPTCIGTSCLTGEACAIGAPAGSNAPYLMHEKMTIGKIKQCKMICDIPGGICSKMTFILEGAEGVSQGGKQAAKQFGKPKYTKEGAEFVYSWTYTEKDQLPLQIKMVVSADIQHGMLYVYGQD
jgi:hypothetical protein